jgi:acyl carrier protein
VDIKTEVRNYITETYPSYIPNTGLRDDTPLVTRGLIDSLGMLGMVAFLEGHFGVEFLPREVDMDNLDTINLIDGLVRKKLAELEAVSHRTVAER